MKITKTIKLKIYKPVNNSWEEVDQILKDLKYNSSKVLNYTIQKCYEWMNFRLKYKEQNGEYPKDTEIFDCSHRNNIYKECRNKFPIFNSKNLSQTIGMAIKRWNADEKDIMKLRKTIPSYTLDSPIYVANQSIKINSNSRGKYFIKLSLLSKDFNDQRQYEFEVFCRDNSTKTILDRLISGEYKKGYGQIIYDKRKRNWFFSISYSFEPKKKELNKDRILGVDLGIVYPIYMAINDSLHRYKIEGGEIEQFRKSIEKRKRELLTQGKYCGDGRRGRGIKKRIDPIDFARKRVSNFRNTINHKYSKFVVEIALKHNCGVIQMEKLEGINENNTYLKNWSYYDLQQKIEYKAKEHGIVVRYISPDYTSQRCSNCGFIDKENRETQSIFKCKKCGFEINADYNAAKNIATKNIEKIIKRTLENK